MTTGFLLHLIVVLIVCGILWLIANWVIGLLGLGEPWPKVVMLLIALVIIIAVIGPLLGIVTPFRLG
jgi:hypothetical protein